MKKHGNLFWFPLFKGCNTNKTKELNMNVKLVSKLINDRINWNLSLIKEYNNELKDEDKPEKEIELIQKSIQLIEREQTFLIDLLEKSKVYK